jgi:regulator of sirC expression with transglutaminase-like and TPR domain
MTQAIEAELSAVGRAAEDGIDIARAALALAALDRPAVNRKPYLDHLDELAADVALQKPEGLPGAAAALSQTLAEAHGYAGDQATYDDMQNANLMRVIDRRKGLPVALGILYLHAGRAQGWRVHGLNFPGHFLIRLELAAGRAILDPFAGGRLVEADQLRLLARQAAGANALDPRFTEAVPDREVLLRLLNNIKSRALQQDDPERAAEILHRMTLIAPVRGALWGELGLVESKRGNLGHAIQALTRWRDMATSDGERQRAATALQQTRSRLN